MRNKFDREYTKEEQAINRTLMGHYNFMLGIAQAKANKRLPKPKRTKVPYSQRWGKLGSSEVASGINKEYGIVMSRKDRKEFARTHGKIFTPFRPAPQRGYNKIKGGWKKNG